MTDLKVHQFCNHNKLKLTVKANYYCDFTDDIMLVSCCIASDNLLDLIIYVVNNVFEISLFDIFDVNGNEVDVAKYLTSLKNRAQVA